MSLKSHLVPITESYRIFTSLLTDIKRVFALNSSVIF